MYSRKLCAGDGFERQGRLAGKELVKAHTSTQGSNLSGLRHERNNAIINVPGRQKRGLILAFSATSGGHEKA